MDYVQTVLASIQATKFDEASAPGGLLEELESHRDYLAGQRGSRGMSVTRSANPEGDVLVVVETRWAANNDMADYSSRDPNVAGILNRHAALLVPGSVQVHRMQSEKSEAQDAPNRVYDRLALALFWPVGILAFALVVIFALSRIYLTLPGSWATPMAVGIALIILGLAWYFAANPSVPRWQWAGAGAVLLIALGISGTAAAVYDDKHAEVKHAEGPVATAPAGGTPAAPGTPEIDMGDNFFADLSGNKSPTVTVKSGETIPVHNRGTALHNVHVAASGSFDAQFCKTTDPAPCSKPAQVPAGTDATLTVNIPPGTYNFRCDFHTAEMNGKLVVQ